MNFSLSRTGLLFHCCTPSTVFISCCKPVLFVSLLIIYFVFSLYIRCWVAGWGKNDFQGNFSFVQRKADLPIVDRTQCQNKLSTELRKTNGPRSKNFQLQDGELWVFALNLYANHYDDWCWFIVINANPCLQASSSVIWGGVLSIRT